MFVEMAANRTNLKQRELAALKEENALKALSRDDYHIHILTEQERSLFETALPLLLGPIEKKLAKPFLKWRQIKELELRIVEYCPKFIYRRRNSCFHMNILSLV